MKYPKLTPPAAQRQYIETFGGYNQNPRIGDGEFAHMENMTSQAFPVLSPRPPRGYYVRSADPEAMLYKEEVFYISSGCVYHKDGLVDWALKRYPQGRAMVSMGAYVVILPEKIWFNSARYIEGNGTVDKDKRFGSCEAAFRLKEESVQISPCRADGTVYDGSVTKGDIPPEEPQPGDLWIDTSGAAPAPKQWSQDSWQEILTSYVRIDAHGIGEDFAQYDGVEVSGLTAETLSGLNGSNVIWAKGDDYIVLRGFLAEPVTQAVTMTVSRTMPEMDFVIECGNRLWGCRYGENAQGKFVNQIYCSKLGDLTNWNSFMGISTDSAVINLGSDGPFTGAVSYMGHPIFFKENVLHKVYISPTGAHSVVETPCAGVQEGCGKSLAVVGNTLYYKSRSGIMVYDGSQPVALPPVFGSAQYDSAVAGAFRDRYYVSMRRADDTHHLFVYDTQKGLWHREDDLQVQEFAAGRDKLYAISGSDILILAGADEPTEGPVSWLVRTGPMGIRTPDRQYLSRLNVRISLEQGAEASFYVQYDFSPRWEHLCTVTSGDLRSFEVPIRPKRCDYMRLEIRGRGDGRIYSFAKTLEQGSDAS